MRLLRKIYQKLKEFNREPPIQESVKKRYADNLSIHESSFLQEQSTFYFNPLFTTKEKKCVSIGKKCLITANFRFETEYGEIIIGDNVYMGDVTLISKTCIEIGNNVLMAWGIILYDHDAHSTDWYERSKDSERSYNDFINYNGNLNVTKDWSVVSSKKIKIEDNVWIGFDVLILKGVTVGKGAVIAAKSVVTKDVPPWTLVAGNPAQVVKQLNSYE